MLCLDNFKERLSYLGEGVFLAVLTAIGYLLSYQFERGFCDYWDIPSYYIEISIPIIIGSALCILLFLYFIFSIVNIPILIFNKIFQENDSFKKKYLIFNLYMFAWIIINIFQYGFSIMTIISLSIPIFFNIFIIIPSWITDYRKYNDNSDFFSRIERSFYKEKQSKTYDGIDWIKSKFGNSISDILFIYFPFAVIISSSFGYIYAKHYYMYFIDSENNIMLIKKYNDYFLMKKIDFDKKIILKEIVVYRPDDISKLKLIKTSIKNFEYKKEF